VPGLLYVASGPSAAGDRRRPRRRRTCSAAWSTAASANGRCKATRPTARCGTAASPPRPAHCPRTSPTTPKAVYVREDAIVSALDAWLPTLADPEWLASTQEPESSIEKRHASLRARLPEIDEATTNLVTALEAGTDPAVINPRLADLHAEREEVTRQLASLRSAERLSPMDIDALLVELGGLGSVLREATPPERRASTTASGSASSTTQRTRRWSPRPTWAVSLVVSEDRHVHYGHGPSLGRQRFRSRREERVLGPCVRSATGTRSPTRMGDACAGEPSA
jgi:hypothetical protein